MSASSQIADLIGGNSVVLVAAQNRAIAIANARGILNSSAVIEAASKAVIDAAMDLVRLEQVQAESEIKQADLELRQKNMLLQQQEFAIKEADLALREKSMLLQETESEIKKAELLLRAAQQDNQVEQFLQQLNYNYATLNTTSFHRYASAIQNIMLSTMDDANKSTAINNVIKVYLNDTTDSSDVSRSISDIESDFVPWMKFSTSEIDAAQKIVSAFCIDADDAAPSFNLNANSGLLLVTNKISCDLGLANISYLIAPFTDPDDGIDAANMANRSGEFVISLGNYVIRTMADVKSPAGTWKTIVSKPAYVGYSSNGVIAIGPTRK